MANDSSINNSVGSAIDRKNVVGRMLLEIFIFMLPMVKFVELKIGGRLFMTEIIIFALFMFMLVTNRIRLKLKTARTFIILCLFWLCGQIITDLVRDTPFIDYSRGWARIIFTIINFTVLYIVISKNKRTIVIFAAGLATGEILEYLLNPGVFAFDYPWKFGVGPAVTLILVIIASSISQNKNTVGVGLLATAFVLNMYFGFRSMAGICFLTTTYVLMKWFWERQKANTLLSPFKGSILLCAILIAASFLLIKGYGYAARQGYLGEKAQQLYNWQGYGNLGILIGGRSEILVSGRAVLDSPFIGHGSWAKDDKYADALIELKRLRGYYAIEYDESGLIPTHSHLFGAWVEAGIAGAIFWTWVLSLPIRCIVNLCRQREPFTALFIFICLSLLWDIFFSPYAGDRRFITPYYVVAIMTVMSGFHIRKQTIALCIKKALIR